MREHLGEFNVESGRVRVTDPCYSPGVWCSGELEVAAGKYEAYVKRSG